MELERIPWTAAEPPVESALHDRLTRDGFGDVFRWHDAPDSDYAAHSRDHDESLWVLDGEITFGIDGRDVRLRAGDRLMLPSSSRRT